MTSLSRLILMMVGLTFCSFYVAADETALLNKAATGAHRSDKNIARNAWRHPVETLAFFGITNDMKVAEVWPGSRGWYTEVLAAYLRDNGTLLTLNYDGSTGVGYFARGDKNFRDKLAADPAVYDKVVVANLMPPESYPDLGELQGNLDMVLTFRNIHNWVRNGIAEQMFEQMYGLLKPGGTLGLVAHRGTDAMTDKSHATTGYLAESVILGLAKGAGFELSGRSEINANPKDTKDHPEGVWTLPPSYRLGDVDREKYQAIGASDRMTLKFTKPE